MINYFEEFVEELKTMIPKALWDKASDATKEDQWRTCVECVHEMAEVWEESNGENLIWVPGHYETKDSDDYTTPGAPPLSYPYYQQCFCDENGCYDEDFGKEDRLFGFLGALFVQNIVNKYNPGSDKIRVFYHVGKFNTYEITLTPVTGSDLQAGDGGTITNIEWCTYRVPCEPGTIGMFIRDKVNKVVCTKNDTLRIQFNNKTYCELKVVAQR